MQPKRRGNFRSGGKTEKVRLRKASRSDSKGFLDLVVALANFERLPPPTLAGRRRLISDIFEKKRAELFVAVVGKVFVGYALYYFTYSSFLAKRTLYLEDIFVLEEFRRKGIGKSLFMLCAKEASKQGCGRMEWAVLTWNEKAVKFYEKIGARRLDEWQLYRLTSDNLRLIS
ncbi:MAG: GNAT family N-acetyltransferase [Thaumarchaeota archaeon]|nr:GNAT family N-acetyltransferase [Nitrososphaerota archaeon]